MSDSADFNRALGANVARLRRARGMSQAELASRLVERGLPFQQPTVLKVEKGTRPLRAEELHAVAELLGVSMDEMAGYTSSETRARALSEKRAAELEISALAQQIQALQAQRDAALSRQEAALRQLAEVFTEEGRPDMAVAALHSIQTRPDMFVVAAAPIDGPAGA